MKSTGEERQSALSSLQMTILLLVFFLLGSLLFINVPVPRSNLFIRDLLNNSHFLLFCVLGLIVLKLVNRKAGVVKFWPGKNYLKSILLGILLSVATELLQMFTNRQFQFRDIQLNIIGIFFIHGIVYCWTSFAFQQRFDKMKWPARVSSVGAALFILLMLFGNVAKSFHHQIQTERQFPLLASFEEAWELNRWEKQKFTDIEISEEHVSHGQHSLQVETRVWKYPGVILEYPPQDWSGFHAMKCTFFNPDTTAFKLHVRFDERRIGAKPQNRIYRISTILPGQNELSFNLQTLKIKATNKPFDLKNVSRVVFFLHKPEKNHVFYFDNLRLE